PEQLLWGYRTFRRIRLNVPDNCREGFPAISTRPNPAILKFCATVLKYEKSMLKKTSGTLIDILPKASTGPKLDLGPVVIESRLLETPLSVSYLGTHTGLNVPVVVRVMHPEIKPLLKDFDRLIDESRRLGRIRHANIAGVLDVGEIEDHAYMVMEYITGIPLV